MSNRRIGHYINPTNGDVDWLEPATVKHLNVRKVSEDYEVVLDNIDCERVVTIKVTDKSNNWSYTYKIDEQVFADEFARIVYSDKNLEDDDIFKSWVREAINSLRTVTTNI